VFSRIVELPSLPRCLSAEELAAAQTAALTDPARRPLELVARDGTVLHRAVGEAPYALAVPRIAVFSPVA